MFPRNAVTCNKCFRVFCCRTHRKEHEGRCSARVVRSVEQNPEVLKKSSHVETEKKSVTVRIEQSRKRKFCKKDSPNPTRMMERVAVPDISGGFRKKRVAIRRCKGVQGVYRLGMTTSLPALKEEDEGREEENEKSAKAEPAKNFRSNLGQAYMDFKRGSLSASPISLPGDSCVTHRSACGSTPLPTHVKVAASGDISSTPVTLEVPKPTHHNRPGYQLAEAFRTSTPKDSDEKKEPSEGGAADGQQAMSALQLDSHRNGCLSGSMEESPVVPDAVPEESTEAPNGKKETFLIGAEPTAVTPMTLEVHPVRHCNVLEGIEITEANQYEDLFTNQNGCIGQTFLVGHGQQMSDPATPFTTPFARKKKKVSWSSDTYETATPYYSARSHFSSCSTPVTPLQNPSYFTSVKDAFKNLVSRMPGTSDELSPTRKRLKLVAESRINCRPTYKGRHSKSRSYLVFNN